MSDRQRDPEKPLDAVSTPATEWAWRMVREGRARWNGQKPVVAAPRGRLRGGATLSQAVIEDRDDRA